MNQQVTFSQRQHRKEQTVRPTIISAVVGLVTATAMMTVGQTAAAATAGGGGAAGTRAGPDAVRTLLAKDSSTGHRPSAEAVAAVARYKAQHDTQAAIIRAAAAASAAHNARKTAMFKNGRARPTALRSQSVVSGSGYAYLSPLNQQGQQTSYWCGPATVSEMALTTPGPSWVDQATAASYMGTDGSGTGVTAMVNGLNHYVGVPDFGWNFYGFVSVNYTPTAAQRATFLSNVQSDVSVNSPVAGDAWEVAGGPHLTGHPANQTIFHWFEIGGWNTNSGQIYYADSATTIWSSVPPYSWYNTYNLVTILGGRGYIW